MMNGADEVSPELLAVAVKFVDDIIQKATRELQKDQWKGEPDQKLLSSSLGKEEISPTGLAGVTSQHPDKDQDQWKGEPDQKSMSPSLGKEVMSPIGLAGVTSQRPDKDLDGGLTYLPQLNVACRAPQCKGNAGVCSTPNHQNRPTLRPDTACQQQHWVWQRRRKKNREDNPKGEPDLSPRHGKEEISHARLAGVTSQRPDKELGEGIKHAERKVPQHVRSADSSFCMRRKHRSVHPQPSEESPIQSSRSLPAAALISAEENKSGIRTTVLNEETLVLRSLETSSDNIPEEENRSAALRGETVEQEGEGRDQEVGQQTLENPKGVESLRERDQEMKGAQRRRPPPVLSPLLEEPAAPPALPPLSEEPAAPPEGDGLLFPPPPPEGDELLFPPPPPERDELLFPPLPPEGDELLFPPPPPEGDELLFPPPPPEGDELLFPPPPPEGDELLFQPLTPKGDELLFSPPPPEGDELLFPLPPPEELEQALPPAANREEELWPLPPWPEVPALLATPKNACLAPPKDACLAPPKDATATPLWDTTSGSPGVACCSASPGVACCSALPGVAVSFALPGVAEGPASPGVAWCSTSPGEPPVTKYEGEVEFPLPPSWPEAPLPRVRCYSPGLLDCLCLGPPDCLWARGSLSPQHQKRRFWVFKGGGGHLGHVVLRTRKGEKKNILVLQVCMYQFTCVYTIVFNGTVPVFTTQLLDAGTVSWQTRTLLHRVQCSRHTGSSVIFLFM
ncbi:UNVERIFIED_CONTAM: hypothetical protein FKN15_000383 [Acipenser sinensis]